MYLFPKEWLTEHTQDVASWRFSLTTHPAPKNKMWGATANLQRSKLQRDFVATQLLKQIEVTNMTEETKKNGSIEEIGKYDVSIFTPVTWKSDATQATTENVEMVNAMVLDFDGINDDAKDKVLAAFDNVCHIAYSSFSNKGPHSKGMNAFRVVVALDKPVPRELYADQYRRGFWYAIASIFPNLDEACKGPKRFWFLPSYRIDRKELAWTQAKSGYVLNTEYITEFGMTSLHDHPIVIPQHPQPEPLPTDNGQGVGQQQPPPPQQDQDVNGAGENSRYILNKVNPRTHMVRGHDQQIRPMWWYIENWETLPKNVRGNYQCCANGSTTVGSAFIHRNVDDITGLARYRETSTRNRTHFDSLLTDNGIFLTYANNGSRWHPKPNLDNVRIAIELLDLHIWKCARTEQKYMGREEWKEAFYGDIYGHLKNGIYFERDIDLGTIKNACEIIFAQNEIDTLKEQLKTLTWDGTPRLETMFVRFLDAADTNLNRTYARKFGISAIARVFDWGCKVDTMLIIQSRQQGLGKTVFWESLAGKCTITGHKWYNTLDGDFSNYDNILNCRMAWINDWGELSGATKADINLFKSWMTKREDRYRPKYERNIVTKKRHFIVTGTTNDDILFRDDTGTRRFWVIKSNSVKKGMAYTESDLIAERDQIWAEAYHYYKQGEQWWLTEEEQASSSDDNNNYFATDIHEEMIQTWLYKNPERVFKLPDLIEDVYTETYTDHNGEERKRQKILKPKQYMPWYVGILKKLGCVMLNDGKRTKHKGELGFWYKAPKYDDTDTTSNSEEENQNMYEYEVNFDNDGQITQFRFKNGEWKIFWDLEEHIQSQLEERYGKQNPPAYVI